MSIDALGPIEAARRGDAAALHAIMRERRTQVVRYAMRLCISPEDAEDATQEVLIALSRRLAALRDVAALSRWIFLAVRTHCTRLARREIRKRLVNGEAHALDDDAAPSAEDLLVDEQLRLRVSTLIGELGPTLREVLIRRDILDEPASDVASALGLTIEAVKSRLHRARAELKTRLLASMKERPLRVEQGRSIS